jgi:hypothetical protein
MRVCPCIEVQNVEAVISDVRGAYKDYLSLEPQFSV